MHGRILRITTDAPDANDTIARANRADFDEHGTAVVNFMSAPGAGKTSLLERALEVLQHELSIGVLEGEVQGRLDEDRISRFHAAGTQLNTDPASAGESHLDANSVRSALSEIPLDGLELLVIENVGNLVCPAEFRVGENHRVMITSVTEGEDKALKYPLMFRACDLVLLNKVDLSPHVDYDIEEFLATLDEVHPGVPYILTSTRTGMGIEAWCEWLRARSGAKRMRERARAHA